MDLLTFVLVVMAISFVAGVIGALLGLGGGVIMVPVLSLFLHLDLKYAIGASIVSVIATSSGAAAAYVRDHLTNLRVGMFLEIATTSGAVIGAILSAVIGASPRFIIFGLVLLYSLYPIVRQILTDRRHARQPDAPVAALPPPDPIATALGLDGEYFDQATGQVEPYHVRRIPLGMAMMSFAGIASGLLGIGAGVFKVLAMDTAMRMPIKISTATSNFMIGATAAASAGIYFLRGEINPLIAAPVALGVLGGSLIGTRLLVRLKSGTIRVIFAIVLAAIAVQMLLKGFGIGI